MAAKVSDVLEIFANNLPSIITPDVSAASMLSFIDKAEKSTHGGRLWNYDGKPMSF